MNNIRRAALAALLFCIPGFAFDSSPVYPTVTFVQPNNNSTVPVGSPITLQASPSEQGGTIAQVVFTIGSTVIGTVKAAPWQIMWTPTSQGTFSVRALALDSMNHGGSATINIMAGPAGSGQPFTLTVVNGTGGGTYAAGTLVNGNAVPPAGQVFQNWSGVALANPSAPSFSFMMPSANVVLTANCVTPQMPAIQSVNPLQLPLGVFAVSVAGTGFSGGTTAQLNGSALTVTAFTATTLSVSGFAGTPGLYNLTVANGPAVSAAVPVQVGVQNPLVSASAARRFLEQAAFGATPADAAHLQTIGFQAWINEQFAMAPVSNYSAANPGGQSGLSTVFLANAVTNADQLRQRIAFALSQIFVTSMMKLSYNSNMIPYQQMLLNDAFTSYRQILGDVTLSPAMGWYLDMVNNAVANPAAGTVADENYAREVMQLFSIGTKLLNQDGTTQNDSSGQPLPSYGQTDVTELARVLTGWAFASVSTPGQPVWGALISSAAIDMTASMVAFSPMHDYGAKSLVNGYNAPANLSPQLDLQYALNSLAGHPNTAPFISMQLIEHLVKSNPSPGYVSRVAAAFSQSSGDMKTVITAILLDPEARANDAGGNDQATDGHYQEPALLLPAFIRAFGGQMTPGNYFSSNLASLGQDVYNPASAFNYYSPSFVAPGSGGLLGPEFQLDNPNAAVLRENLVAGFFDQYSNPVQSYGPGTTVDLSPFVPLAGNPATLLSALDLTLTHGTMPAGMKQIILTAMQGEQISSLHMVETGIYLILMSGYYNVWH